MCRAAAIPLSVETVVLQSGQGKDGVRLIRPAPGLHIIGSPATATLPATLPSHQLPRLAPPPSVRRQRWVRDRVWMGLTQHSQSPLQQTRNRLCDVMTLLMPAPWLALAGVKPTGS
ncbi:unnamed protein product [Boreogadus saida]